MKQCNLICILLASYTLMSLETLMLWACVRRRDLSSSYGEQLSLNRVRRPFFYFRPPPPVMGNTFRVDVYLLKFSEFFSTSKFRSDRLSMHVLF